MSTAVAPSPRPPVWRDARVLRIAGQVLFVGIVVFVLREMYLNATFTLAERGRELSYDFLDSRADFGIKEHIISFHKNNDAWRAFFVAVTNALLVAVTGIVLATIVGLFLGIARLSPNWLVNKIAQTFVDVVRNTPLLVQLIFWYVAVILPIPTIQESLSFFDVVFVSNRGAAIPAIRGGADFGLWGLFVLAGLVGAIALGIWRTRVHEATGRPHFRTLIGIGTVLGSAILGYLLLGDAFGVETPELREFDFAGGLQMSPEFAAILVAVVVYTAAFIGEIVRGSILAVSKGQKEAAQALGLSAAQQLRLVVLPQAMRIAIPPINNQYLNLWKNTSLAFAVGYPEIVNISQTMVNQKGHELEVFSLVVLAYLLVSLAISLVMNIVNRLVSLKGDRR